MQSKAATVSQYLAEIPADRRAAIAAVRDVIRGNLDRRCAEGMSYGMIGWSVPHSVYPPGYHCDPRQPLPVAGLASQKSHMSLYLMGLYCGCEGGGETEYARWFREAWAGTGKKLDMGKACIRFKKLDDLPLEVIGEAVRRMSVKAYIEQYEQALAKTGRAPRTTARTEAKTTARPEAKPTARHAAKPTARPAAKPTALATAKTKAATGKAKSKPSAATSKKATARASGAKTVRG